MVCTLLLVRASQNPTSLPCSYSYEIYPGQWGLDVFRHPHWFLFLIVTSLDINSFLPKEGEVLTHPTPIPWEDQNSSSFQC